MVIAIQPNWLIFIANILIPIAIIFFSIGFFPYKPLIPGLAVFEEPHNVPPKVFDKVIFMVVDSLRSDFVYSNMSGFSFTQSLIESGAAVPFTAYAGAPTVTMPRLKAITTGSVPSFLDVVLNIAESDTSSTLIHQDTWLAQIKAKGEHLIMYGDDTWLKLFPGLFSRFDGTTSFFVSDFTEVDTNVTRHVSNELLQDDWSAFIMHYLGLDHIGHKSGPQSAHMIPKQREMDSIVSSIYRALEQEVHLKSTLLVLCGDHGMNDAGNHGGSSMGETSPALVFISPKLKAMKSNRSSPVDAIENLQYYQTVDQTDITPTLAGLLGLPIPLNNLGVFIPDFLDLWSSGYERVHLLHANSKQLLKVITEAFPSHSFESDELVINCDSELQNNLEGVKCFWLQAQKQLHEFDPANSDDSHAGIESALFRFLRASQKLMSSASSNYNLKYLYLGLSFGGLALCFSLPAICSMLLKHRHPGTFMIISVLSYGALMFASSYVEEEQQFWYWLFSGWAFYLHVKCPEYLSRSPTEYTTASPSTFPLTTSLRAVGLMILHRILRRWNQTGQKFTAEPDIARSFFPFHQGSLWALVALTYVDSYFHLASNLPRSLVFRLLGIFLTTTAFCFKLVFAASESPELLSRSPLQHLTSWLDRISLVLYARLVFGGTLVVFLLSLFTRNNKKSFERRVSSISVFHEALNIFLITQSRTTNVPIFLIFRLQLSIITILNLTAIEITITSLLMQYASFFAFGGSNSISSIDLSNAYNGIESFNLALVGALTFISNWAGPIWWVSATRLLRGRQSWKEKQAHIALLTFYLAATLLSVMAACTALRTHLFIWTVFSPKYLYSLSWSLVHHYAVNLLGEIFW